MKLIVLASDAGIDLELLLELDARGAGAIGPGPRGGRARLVEGSVPG